MVEQPESYIPNNPKTDKMHPPLMMWPKDDNSPYNAKYHS
jgi:hypothetical protein